MQTKVFELRDVGTFLVVLAIRLESKSEQERYLLSRAGFGKTAGDQSQYIYLLRVTGGMSRATYDAFEWADRTYQTAHEFIETHFDDLESGSVVDVEFILGETDKPKKSEAEDSVL